MPQIFDVLEPWAVVATYVGAWAAVALLFGFVLKRLLARLASRKPTAFNEVLASSLPRPAGIAVFLLAMSVGIRLVPTLDRIPEKSSIAWLRVAEIADPLRKAFPIFFGVLAISVLMRVGFRAIDAYGKSNPQLRSTAGIGRAAVWVIGIAAVALFVCDALGISLAPALTALGVGSLAFALAIQETLANFFAGVYLLADKPVSPGDFIRIDTTHEGYVEAIGWRSTQLRTLANNLVIVPNAMLSKAVITNFSRPTVKAGVEVRIDVAVDSDVDRVEAILADEAKALAELPEVIKDSPPAVRFHPGMVDGVLAFTVSCLVETFAVQGSVQHELRKRIARRFKKEGIALAVPLAKR